MYKNYLVIALRNLQTRKQYAVLTIIGMMTGIACALITAIFVRHEFSYENWIPDVDNIYRVEQTYHFPGAPEYSLARVSPLVADSLQHYFGDIAQVTRWSLLNNVTVKRDNDAFSELVTLVDDNFIDFFSLSLVQGDKAAALGDINGLLLSESMAKKYFADTTAIGQTLTLDGSNAYRVTGVFKDLPANTHLQLDFIARYDQTVIDKFVPPSRAKYHKQWNGPFSVTYFKLKAGADINNIADRLDDYVNSHYAHPSPARAAMTPTEFVHFNVRAIADIHLYSKVRGDLKPGNPVAMVFGFFAIALLILTVAIINYASLATATSTLRAREIGLRKVLGAGLGDIRIQFIGEALITALVATILAMLATQLLLPRVTGFLNLPPGSLQLFGSATMVLTGLLIGLLSGLLAGLYPAFYLASVRPVKVLGANKSTEKATSLIRSVLLVLQFSVTIGLLVALTVVSRQTDFVSKVNMGFDKDGISILGVNSTVNASRVQTLLQQLRALPGVSASASSHIPTNGQVTIPTAVQLPERQGEDALSAVYTSVDEQFFALYGLELLAGRVLSSDYANDRVESLADDITELDLNMVINRSAVNFIAAQSPQQAIGKQFKLVGGWDNRVVNVTVVGVIEDVNFGSAYERTEPMFFVNRMDMVFNISIKSAQQSQQNGQQQIQAKIRHIWQTVAPDDPIILEQMDALISAQYDDVKRQNTLLLVLSGLAIVISCLGVFGMASFSVHRRTKEIGIRKVLGAGVKDIMALMMLQFSKPVVVAMLIAWPLSGYIMSDWLQGFVLRIELSVWYFLFAGVAALLITWLTVGGHVYKAARAKPVEALRYE